MNPSEKPDRPGIRVPPPLLFIAGIAAGLTLDRWVWSFRILERPSRIEALHATGVALLIIGVAVILWSIHTFRRAHTTVLPFSPASTIVQRGPYLFSRNPMYVGMMFCYLGIAFIANSGWPLLLIPAVLIALHFMVIAREEAYLARAFAQEYAAYRSRVRRWI